MSVKDFVIEDLGSWEQNHADVIGFLQVVMQRQIINSSRKHL